MNTIAINISGPAEPLVTSTVFECDGPPRAYFEVSDGIRMVRILYRAIYARRAAEDVATAALAAFLVKLRAELVRISESGAEPLIFWRRRPVTSVWDKLGEQDRIIKDGYSASCRLETSPPIPDDWWKTYCIYDHETQRYSV